MTKRKLERSKRLLHGCCNHYGRIYHSGQQTQLEATEITISQTSWLCLAARHIGFMGQLHPLLGVPDGLVRALAARHIGFIGQLHPLLGVPSGLVRALAARHIGFIGQLHPLLGVPDGLVEAS